jgi:hypothetical protein
VTKSKKTSLIRFVPKPETFIGIFIGFTENELNWINLVLMAETMMMRLIAKINFHFQNFPATVCMLHALHAVYILTWHRILVRQFSNSFAVVKDTAAYAPTPTLTLIQTLP